MSGKSKVQYAVAACSIELQADGNVIQLLPSSEHFTSIDGRPTECAAWFCDAAVGARLAAAAAARSNDFVIDYDHQTLRAEHNGQPAPAAGWFHALEYRAGNGMVSTDVRWTDRAAQMIASKEYRYISPVFAYDKKTGEVLAILHAGLTNNPGLDGMAEIAALAATIIPNDGEYDMDELLERLRWFFNLPITATADDIKAQLDKLREILKPAQTAEAANGVDLIAFVSDSTTRIAALTADLGDVSKYVPVAQVAALQSELATLKAAGASAELDRVVTEALNAGKLLPALEPWARELGKKDLAALKQYVDAAVPIAALGGSQTGGREPGAGAEGAETFNAPPGYSVNQEKLGIHNRAVAHMSAHPGVTYVAAVQAVSKT